MRDLEEKKNRDKSESPEKKSSVWRQKLEDNRKSKRRTPESERLRRHFGNNKRLKGLELKSTMLNKSVLSMNLTPDKLKPQSSDKKSVTQRTQPPRRLSRKDKRRSDSKTSGSKRRMPKLELRMRGEERSKKRPLTRETQKSGLRTFGFRNGMLNNL